MPLAVGAFGACGAGAGLSGSSGFSPCGAGAGVSGSFGVTGTSSPCGVGADVSGVVGVLGSFGVTGIFGVTGVVCGAYGTGVSLPGSLGVTVGTLGL